ncbi:MAG TPA: TrbG/VirB9 family P-type conjugative transfer protein [Polyangia bacterium]|nr:TrbG/VirB9 family P-type conjugative transfer protein [Polyangia bacterium]
MNRLVERTSSRALGLAVGIATALLAASAAEARGRAHTGDGLAPPSLGPTAAAVNVAAAADTLRLPYSPGKVYQVRLLPGAPFALELPAGESAKNIWFDNHWWAAESTPGASRVFLRALGSSDVVGRTGFVHIETDPSDLRLSLRVEAVRESAIVPAALEIYIEGSALNDPAQRQMRKSISREVLYAQKQAEEQARAQFDSWRKNAMVNLRGDEAYDRGGDFLISRVVDDKVQTFISVPNATDRAVIQFVDKTGRPELVNYEIENATYVVQNKVLRPGEKFRLILGKEQGWVALR